METRSSDPGANSTFLVNTSNVNLRSLDAARRKSPRPAWASGWRRRQKSPSRTGHRRCGLDREHPANNDSLLVSQFSVAGVLYTCRPDLVGFVNGLPLVVIELKKPGVPARAAFDENLTHDKNRTTSRP